MYVFPEKIKKVWNCMLLKAYCNNTSPRSAQKRSWQKFSNFPWNAFLVFGLGKWFFKINKVNLLKFGDDGFLSVGGIKPVCNVFRYVSNIFFVSQDFLNYRYLIIHFIKFPLNHGWSIAYDCSSLNALFTFVTNIFGICKSFPRID